MINWAQISGIVDRLALVGLTWVASKGWINSADVAGLATMVVGIIGSIYAYWVNRASNLTIRAASANPQQIIVADAKLAESTPNQPNIVSENKVKVVTK